jgi:hypothetical protein
MLPLGLDGVTLVNWSLWFDICIFALLSECMPCGCEA